MDTTGSKLIGGCAFCAGYSFSKILSARRGILYPPSCQWFFMPWWWCSCSARHFLLTTRCSPWQDMAKSGVKVRVSKIPLRLGKAAGLVYGPAWWKTHSKWGLANIGQPVDGSNISDPLSFDLSLFIIIYLYFIYISFFLWDLISILMGFQDVRGNCDHTKRSRGHGVGPGAHHCLWLNAMSSRLERKPGKTREPSEDRQLLVQLLKAMLTINWHFYWS